MSRLGMHIVATMPLVMWSASISAQKPDPKPADGTGSALTEKEAQEFLAYHNKVRKDVEVGPVKWSNTLAKFAQEWADNLAANGDFEHRPAEGKWAQKYGENIAIDQTALKGAEAWYAEIKDYKPGTAIPADITEHKAGHYTQMVWKKTTQIGAGSAVVKQGRFKGLVLTVCNYDPPGNFVGEKPY
jgi:pathogenesis-related protein 1